MRASECGVGHSGLIHTAHSRFTGLPLSFPSLQRVSKKLVKSGKATEEEASAHVSETLSRISVKTSPEEVGCWRRRE